MANRNYQFYIYESNLFNKDVHPVTGIATAGIHTAVSNITRVARDKRVNLALNNGGQVTFRIPIDAPEALQIVNYEVMRCLVVYVDDANGNPVPRWSGPIWNIEMTTSGSSVAVTVVGWQELLNHRELRRNIFFTGLDAGVIATRLLSTVNNQNSNSNVVPATNANNSNSQRTGINTGGANAEDLLFGAGDFEYAGNFWDSPGAVNWLGNPPSITSEWAVSGASSLKVIRANNGSGGTDLSFVYVEIPSGVRVNSNGASVAPIEPSSTYELRYSVNNLALGSGGGSSQILVLVLDAAMTIVSFAAGTVNTTLGVTTASLMISTPSNGAYIGIGMAVSAPTNGTSSTCLFDNMTMSKNAVNLVPTPITMGTVSNPANPAGANRTRSYTAGQKMGLALEELSQIEAGFDYEVALVSTSISGGATILRNLNIYYDTVKGTIKGKGADRVDTIFGYRWGPNNLISVRETHDSSKLANRINARSSSMLAMAQDPTSIALRGVMEDSVQVSDAGITPPTLLAYAGAEVVYRAAPFKLYDVVPFPADGEPRSRIPLLWKDYDLGDICYLVADDGAMQIGTYTTPQPIRIFGASISIDAEGNERIDSLKTTYS